jgi:hypothetical protein
MNLLTVIYLGGLTLSLSAVALGYMVLKPGRSRGLFFTLVIFALAWPITLLLILWTALADLILSQRAK